MKKILVVDDSETIRLQVRKALEPGGYQIVEAVDGMDGLDKLRASGDLELVLCDVNMPRMTGLDMIAQVKAEALATPPIVMLTSEGQPSLVRRARESGAKGWIVKPFLTELLLAAVNKLTATK